ncbi:MAG: ADP-forming succinate--CoA ligase subunit beta [SAR324 cluster bacterium]|nr:ADP-forming succinate--CoA ligase subunit beta [SAR324 cluster bacterium]MCZ6842941.1 ADP-forming succinate--CoA ligase subunit beta [SAR324 cluster bacterium]
MKIHEYQAKRILGQYGVPVPRGEVVENATEAEAAARGLGGSVWVVKAQIHAGGRGKGGGVKICSDLEEVRRNAEQILGMQLVTHQTGAEGQTVKKVLIEEGMDIRKELYLSILVDRNTQAVVVLASTEGGMEIEEVAAKTPEKILREDVDPTAGLLPYQSLRLAYGLQVDKADAKLVRPTAALIGNLYRAFEGEDCSLVEINPLVLTGDGRALALDAKVTFDDSALFRHKALEELRDLDEEEALEIEAADADLSYIKLDGNIGCMVNGAGLAMGSMDMIKAVGGEPANFLDIGGGADQGRVETAFRIISKDPNVKCILINIFGGIVRCDVVAEGVVAAFKNVGLSIPVVVRLEGTNADRGNEIIANSGMGDRLLKAQSLREAAEKSVAAAGNI